MPPTPTTPIKKPTTTATAASSAVVISSAPGARSASLLPAHQLLETAELVFLHEHRVFLAGIDARTHFIAIIAQALLDDRHQVDVDLGVPRDVLFVEVEEIRPDDVHAVRAIARAETDHRHRQCLGEVLAHLGGRLLAPA